MKVQFDWFWIDFEKKCYLHPQYTANLNASRDLDELNGSLLFILLNVF